MESNPERKLRRFKDAKKLKLMFNNRTYIFFFSAKDLRAFHPSPLFFFFYEYGVDYSCAATCSSLDLCCNIHLFRQVQSYIRGFVVLLHKHVVI